MTLLACGCERTLGLSRRLCPDAEALWERVATAHNALAKAFKARPKRNSDAAHRAMSKARREAKTAFVAANEEYLAHFVAPSEPEAVEVALL
jgi:hypothetical protein